MILVRQIFKAKYGKAGEVASRMREASSVISRVLGEDHRWRVMTDLTGPFDTVVFEIENDSMAEWEKTRSTMFQHPEFRQSIAPFMDLLDSGESQLFTIEAQG